MFFNISNLNGCDAPNMNWRSTFDNDMPTIFLVKRSDRCSYVQQTRNVQRQGGVMVIIINTDDKDVTDEVLSDDGTGAGIRIPAMLISMSDGEKLEKNFFHTKPHMHNQTILKAEFITEYQWDMLEERQVVSVDYWYNPSDDKSLDFIRNVAKYIEPLTQYINFEPKIVTWPCKHCDDAFKKKNCVSDGKYCGMKHFIDQSYTGKDIIYEGLRQSCLHQLQQQGEDIASSQALKD